LEGKWKRRRSNARVVKEATEKIQDIAEKAIEGSSWSKAMAELQRFMAEQNRKAANEKS